MVAGQQKADDGVVDAEFTEVKDDKIICLFKKTKGRRGFLLLFKK
ncbi:hypothetical protein AB3538_09985 [Acinetobacter baumannii]